MRAKNRTRCTWARTLTTGHVVCCRIAWAFGAKRVLGKLPRAASTCSCLRLKRLEPKATDAYLERPLQKRTGRLHVIIQLTTRIMYEDLLDMGGHAHASSSGCMRRCWRSVGRSPASFSGACACSAVPAPSWSVVGGPRSVAHVHRILFFTDKYPPAPGSEHASFAL